VFSSYGRHLGRRVNAQLTDGTTITGVLVRAGRREVELSEAAMVAHGARTPIDGAVLIERPALAWVQVV
jgi:hypothetical protein